MKRFGLLSTSAIGSAAFMGLSLATAAPAFAQDQRNDETCTPERQANNLCDSEQEIESGEPATDEQSVLVTGSRIRRPNLESNVPVTSVSAEDLTSQGDVNIGDALNDLPSLRSTFSQANSNRFIGTTGLNVLDLRGLGTSRTLVLVNGRRHVTATIGSFQVDTNTIPSDLLERVDVITGGNSAVYGSDAVAGVVNFVLRRDFDGIRLRGQAGTSQQGDRGIQFVSLTAGRNFLDNRANIAINLEYANAEPLYFIDRPELTGSVDGRCQFNLAEPSGGEPATGDGVPDNQFFCNVRNNAISNGGTISATNPIIGGVATACTNPILLASAANTAIGAARCLNPGTAQGQLRTFRFSPDGQLLQDIPSLDFRPFGSGNIIGDPNSLVPGATLRDTGQIAPGLDRYTANILFNLDVSPAFQPFVEAKYVRLFARQEGQPSFFQASFPAFFGGGRGIRCDNPFLDATDLAVLQNNLGRCLGGAASTETIPLGRFNVDFGGRSELVTRQTYRAVAGVRGDFFDDWNYEVSVNYGRVELLQEELNDLHIFNIGPDGAFLGEGPFLQAIDAIRDPVTGQIVCRDPAARAAGCIPINVFGTGQPSPEALAFTNRTSTVEGNAQQYNAVAFVNGDLSSLFELPGGPIRFVIGGEYRRETAFRQADVVSSNFGTFFNAFPVFDPPAFEVFEGFGEIEIPLLRDMPFAHELTVSAAARYSDYNTPADRTFAYNVNGTWAPVRDLRFRANYSRSVRVPTLIDLYNPSTQSFAFVADPCDFRRIGANPNRAANCAALGVPAGFDAVLTNSQTAEIAISGNPFLEEEVGKSLTLGMVFTPRWVPGLSFTVDYYRIDVENLIAGVGAQTVLNLCVDSPTINNSFCPLIFPRVTVDDPATPQSDIGALDSPALRVSSTNFALLEADGIDVELAYRRTFNNGHRLNFRAIATYVLQRTNFIDPVFPNLPDRQLSELGDPRIAANASVTYGIENFDLRYSVNYIGKQLTSSYENFFPLSGRPGTPFNQDVVSEVWYPAQFHHSIRLSTRVNDRFLWYVGVDNVTDEEPPFGLLGGAEGDPYDPIGRYFYSGFTIDF